VHRGVLGSLLLIGLVRLARFEGEVVVPALRCLQLTDLGVLLEKRAVGDLLGESLVELSCWYFR